MFCNFVSLFSTWVVCDESDCPIESHFTVQIEETGESTLFIFSDSVEGLDVGDEVGLFDAQGIIDASGSTGEVLVGAGTWTGDQLEVSAIGSADLSDFGGPILPGYVEGNTMSLKIWDASEGIEYDANYTTSFGSGRFNGLFTNINGVSIDDCDSSVYDCAGVCDGDAVVDDCGYCVALGDECDSVSGIYDCFGDCGGCSFNNSSTSSSVSSWLLSKVFIALRIFDKRSSIFLVSPAISASFLRFFLEKL